MLFGRLDVDPLGIINCCVRVADPDDFDTTFVGERKSRDRANITEPLHDGGTFLGVHLEHVHGALDQINSAAPGCFAPPFSPTDGDRFAGHNFIDGVAHVNGVGVHEPSHDLFVSAHVRPHDVGVRSDEWNHLLHVAARDRLQFGAR